ncbi:alpha/beta fold hydrolase [Sphingomonadaceae bacterium LXI357]|uniref:Alpha/beta fold hydrolase n=2 Tax=Stakelama marina TaxID=2826939 RepID=A0A8T4I9R2_9SPHN|nr:alpha/beta fold hydrolase [Stakelama marina]
MLLAMAMFAVPCAAQAGQQAPAESTIEAPGPDGALQGSEIDAGKGAPVALIIPGSGPTDRDGNSPMGVRAGSLKLLAQGLAARGISSVRIDKRGMFGSKAAIADANKVTIGAYVDDVASWVSRIRDRTGAPCVWVIGHSEGALVALAAGQKLDHLCGLVSLEGAGRPIGEVMREQLRSNPAAAAIVPDAMKAIDSLEAGRTVDVSGMSPVVARMFNPAVQDYEIDLFHYDPARLAAKYDGPLLIVWGTRDIQVTKPDFDALTAAQPGAGTLVIPDMNHVLKSVASDARAANLATYANSDLPLADGLVDGVAAYIKAHPGED